MSRSDMDSGFNLHALRYETRWDDDPVAQVMRDAVRMRLARHVGVGTRVLDLGCGIGTDAAWLAERGADVIAADASAGMIAEARRRVPGLDARECRAEDVATLAADGPFDVVLMDFGVANCVDLGAVALGLATCLRPGGTLIVVPMPRVHPMWMLRELLRGRPGQALGRMAAATDVDVEGAAIATRYLGAGEIRRAFAPWFTLSERRGLGFLLPPPGSRFGGLSTTLARLETPLRRLPGFRNIGDHLVVELVRQATPEPPPAVPVRISAALAQRTGRVRRLHTLLLEATTGCQSRCVACAYRGPAGGEALTPSIAAALVEEAVSLGARSVVVTGGEPLLRSDRAALLEAISAAEVPVTLLSNGLTLTRDAALVARTCAELIVSLDGYDSETYRQTRGVDGLGAVTRGVAVLRSEAPTLPIRARVTVTPGNAESLHRIAERAVEIGFDSVSFLAADLDATEAFGRAGAPGGRGADAATVAAGLARAREVVPPGFVVDSPVAQARIHDKLAADIGDGTHVPPTCNAPYA
ncbi:MAG: methyltransferase domain-containing protein, partial [Myxococcota bacterium]|nr:methyltransferase domain-containing protein [Myxococcota bacterium]